MVEGTYLGSWLTSRFDLNPASFAAWRYLRGGIAVSFAVLAVELLYHFGPDVKQRFRDSLTGAIVAVMTWIGLSCLLGSYFRHFDNLDKTYGPLGAAIGLYVWFYLSGFVVPVGGEINFLLGELRDHRAPESSAPARTQINNLNTAA
jgi:membrane protein